MVEEMKNQEEKEEEEEKKRIQRQNRQIEIERIHLWSVISSSVEFDDFISAVARVPVCV